MNVRRRLFWDIVPYVTIAILVVGTWWRYRYDKFGWTTRSSQLYESRLLRIGSPLFHFGILVVIFGHIIGLVIPESWTSALGLSQDGLSHPGRRPRQHRRDRHARPVRRFWSTGAAPRARCSWPPPGTTNSCTPC